MHIDAQYTLLWFCSTICYLCVHPYCFCHLVTHYFSSDTYSQVSSLDIRSVTRTGNELANEWAVSAITSLFFYCYIVVVMAARFVNSSAKMSFTYFLSVLSVHRIQRPDAIWFHCNHLPDNGDFYWGELWKSVPLTVVYHGQQTSKPELENGLKSAQDSAVVATLLEHGGIFVDGNILVVRSLNPLRNYSTCFREVGFSASLCSIANSKIRVTDGLSRNQEVMKHILHR